MRQSKDLLGLFSCVYAQHIGALSTLVGSLGLDIPLPLERTCYHLLVLFGGIQDSITTLSQQVPVHALQGPWWAWITDFFEERELQTNQKATRKQQVSHTQGPLSTHIRMKSTKELSSISLCAEAYRSDDLQCSHKLCRTSPLSCSQIERNHPE